MLKTMKSAKAMANPTHQPFRVPSTNTIELILSVTEA
jgi:hypothetical protein